MAKDIEIVAENFAAPERGRYVGEPARFDERDEAWLPPAPPDSLPRVATVLGMALLAGGGCGRLVCSVPATWAAGVGLIVERGTRK